MQIMSVDSWSAFRTLADAKGLFIQYTEDASTYNLFAPEAQSFLWSLTLLKGSDDAADFETSCKPTANRPLDYRSTDGLMKVASAKFADTKNLCLDGSCGNVAMASGETQYMKKHFDFEFTLSGVDCRWFTSNFGDYIDFEVGFYTDEADEATFVSVSKFSNMYSIAGDGSRLFDVPAVKVIPIVLPGTSYHVYIRAKCVNTGGTASKVILNLVGWR